ncbi:MAG: tetratricopeptide repeat protein [Candidatus Thermochlorobacter sp.]
MVFKSLLTFLTALLTLHFFIFAPRCFATHRADSIAAVTPDTVLAYGVLLSQKAIGAEARASALHSLALSYFNMNDKSRAQTLWNEALGEVNRLVQPETRSPYLLQLVNLGITLGLEDTAYAIASQIPSLREKTLGLFALTQFFLAKDKARFEKLADETWSAAEALSQDISAVAILSRLSLLYLKSGDTKSGQEALNQALAIQLLPSVETVELFGKLATEFFQAGQAQYGEKLLKTALSFLSKIKNDRESVSSARFALSLLLIDVGELERARPIVAAITNVMDRLSAMQKLGFGFAQRNQPAQAVQLAQQMRQISQSIRNTSDRATALGLIATLLAEAQSQADAAANEALAAINAIPVAFDRSTLLGELAANFAEVRLFDKAELALSQVSIPQHRASSAYRVGRRFALANMPDKAKPLFAEALALRDKFTNAEFKARAFMRMTVESFKFQFDLADSAFSAALTAIADVSIPTKRAELLRAFAADLASLGKIQYALLVIQKMESPAQMAISISDLARIGYEKKIPFPNETLATLKSVVESSP